MDKIQDYVREEIRMIEDLAKGLKYKIRLDSDTEKIIIELRFQKTKSRTLIITPNENINYFTKYILSTVKEQIEKFKLEDKKED